MVKEMADEQRKFPRIATNVGVRFRKEKHSRESAKYLSGIAENCSLGGMLITTDYVLPKGKILKMKFELKAEDGTIKLIRARAIVRWVKRRGSQKGMGVEFIEFVELGDKTFGEWMHHLLDSGLPE